MPQKKKAVYMGSFDRPAPGWHFLADHDGNVQRLAEAGRASTIATIRGRNNTRTPRRLWC